MGADTWRRLFPQSGVLDVVDAIADLVADRVVERLDRSTKPVTERIGLSPSEAAQALGMAESTVHTRIKDGTIKAGRIGGRTVIHRSEIDRLLLGEAS